MDTHAKRFEKLKPAETPSLALDSAIKRFLPWDSVLIHPSVLLDTETSGDSTQERELK